MPYNPFYNIENTELLGYEYAWMNFIRDGHKPDGLFPEYIVDSWVRCKEMGVNPVKTISDFDDGNMQSHAKSEHTSSFYAAARPMIKEMMRSLERDSVNLLIADNTGRCIAKFELIDEVVEHPVNILYSEENMGTNALDLALKLNKPVSLVGAQHYCQEYHRYASYATPVVDKRGKVLAAICLRVLCEDMNDYMLAFVSLIAKVIEDEMKLVEKNRWIAGQNKEKNQILNLVEDGILYSDNENRIIFVNDTLSEMVGEKANKLIGNSIESIVTVPSLAELSSREVELNNMKISLKGKKGKISCILKKAHIRSEAAGAMNIMWIFVTEEEIRILADKVGNANKAYFTFDDILGGSSALKEAIKLAQKVAEFDTRVIIEGESGTGKEMFAQSIHNAGKHSKGPFVAIDCGAIPRELIESEMFGYEEGAFTGAKRGGAKGKFELADNGTLFLDEIENLPLEMQAKLLRVLQENTIVRVGGTKPIPINVQVIAATNVNLSEEIMKKNFREDLFYRLDIIHINIPPLRERKEDVALLVNNFINTHREKFMSNVKNVSPAALEKLIAYKWPGNVRQLNNVIERMIIMCEGSILTEDLLPSEIVSAEDRKSTAFFSVDERISFKELETKYVQTVIDSNNGNIKKTSEQLGLSRATVYKYIKDGGVC